MPLIRGHHSFDDHFTQIPNEWLRDPRLSFKARGLLALILSHTTGWSLSINSLAHQNKEGKDSIRKAINELEEFGYLIRSQENIGGRFGENIWTTVDPSEIPSTENPPSENPTPKKNILKEEQVKETTIRATRIPADFSVTDEMREWANNKYPKVDIDKATENFIDYWETKPSNATKLDWVRTWQVWIRNTKPDTPQRSFQSSAQAKEQRQEEAKKRFLQAFDNQPPQKELDWGQFL